MENIPFCQASENNKVPIGQILEEYLKAGRLLEIGHGTCQHAQYFIEKFPEVDWYATDQKENSWIREKLNLKGQSLQVGLDHLEKQLKLKPFDYLYTCNTFHIMAKELVEICCREASAVLQSGGLFIVYGPFKFQGEFIGPGNENFDKHLKNGDPKMGIRDFEWIKSILEQSGFEQLAVHDMPANNHLLIFRKGT